HVVATFQYPTPPPTTTLLPYTTLFRSPAINLHQLFPASVFVTKYKGMHWVEGFHEFAGLISDALTLMETFDPMNTLVLGNEDGRDRKSTRLNSSHVAISYAVYCSKKKN